MAAPMAAMWLADFGADVIKIEHPTGDMMRTWGSRKERCPALLEGGRAQQTRRHARPASSARTGHPQADGDESRRARGELPAGNARALGTCVRGSRSPQPAPRHVEHLGLRADRAVQFARRLRNARRGDERLRPRHRSARRSADASVVRTRRRHHWHLRRICGDGGPARTRRHERTGSVDRPWDLRATAHRPWTPVHRVRPVGDHRAAARLAAPFRLATQRVQDGGRLLGRDVMQRAEHLRTRLSRDRPRPISSTILASWTTDRAPNTRRSSTTCSRSGSDGIQPRSCSPP